VAYINWYINGYERPWTSSDLNRKMRHDPGQSAASGGVLPVTTEQRLRRRHLSSPSVTFVSRGGIVVSSLVSSVYVRLRSLVFGLMRRCRSRTLTVFGELSSSLLKIGRSGFDPALEIMSPEGGVPGLLR
jgi:hypothetical protein